MAQLTKEQQRALAIARARLRAEGGDGNYYEPQGRVGPVVKETAGDMMRSGASGIAQGMTGLLDLPANIPGYAAQAGSWLGEKAGVIDPQKAQEFRNALTEFRQHGGAGNAARDVAPELMNYKPETTAGEYAQTVGEFMSGLPFGGTAAQMTAAGLASEFGGQIAEGTDYETPARIGGAIVGSGIPGAVRKAVTPNPAEPVRTEAARMLAKEGVPLTAGQRTGNVNLMYQEAQVPRMAQMGADQGLDFTAAVLKRIGVNAKRAEPEVLNAAYKRIGGMFDDLAARNKIVTDRNLVTQANSILRKYEQSTNKNNIAPIVENVVKKIREKLRGNQPISGAEYQQFRSDLGPLVTGSDRQLATAARDLRIALDDAMERSIKTVGSPEDIAAYATARQQYRDYLAIEGAAAKAGTDTAAGVLNPRQLRVEIVRTRGKRDYTTGKSELGEISRAGNITMPNLPNSGTQQRLSANSILAPNEGIGTGGLAYMLTGDPILSGAAGVAGAVAPSIRNRLIGSPLGQSYLSNQLVGPSPNTATEMMQSALAAALVQEENRKKDK